MKPLKEFPSFESPRVWALAAAVAFGFVIASHYFPGAWWQA